MVRCYGDCQSNRYSHREEGCEERKVSTREQDAKYKERTELELGEDRIPVRRGLNPCWLGRLAVQWKALLGPSTQLLEVHLLLALVL